MCYPFVCRGFTVIEFLLIAVFTAVTAALGVSAVHTYVVRQQVAASVTLAGAAQDGVARAFRRSGVPPADDTEAGLPPANSLGDYVEAVRVVDGRIELHFGAAADPAIAQRPLSLTPFETADRTVVWVCGNKVPGVGLEPLGFAGGGRQAVQVLTTIEPRYLPPACR